MSTVSIDQRPSTLLTEAADRAEVTALLIRCGYYVYRPEADINGEDLVVKLRNGRLVAVQQKGRATVNQAKYGGRNIWMLFPSAKYSPELKRDWYFIPHDDLFAWVYDRHGKAPKWNGEWHYPELSKILKEFLEPHLVRPLASAREDRLFIGMDDPEIIGHGEPVESLS